VSTKPVDQKLSQQEFLHEAKAELGLTWDQLAEQCGIAPRAMKNYRMPDASQNHREMPVLAWRAVSALVDANKREKGGKAAGGK
jgi:hypothetical protein